MKYIKEYKIFESNTEKESILNKIDKFIDTLFNHGDYFYNIGDGKYKMKDNIIEFDLSDYENQNLKEPFIEEVKGIINYPEFKEYIEIESITNNKLILKIN